MTPQEERIAALEELAELKAARAQPSFSKNVKTVGGKIKRVGADLLSGLGQGFAGMTQAAGNMAQPALNPMALTTIPAMLAGAGARQLGKDAKALGEAEGQAPGYAKTVTQSIGSAGAMPLGAGSVAGLRGLIGGGAGAGAAQQAATDFDSDNLPLQMAATLVGGAAGGFLAGPKQSVARRDIRLETENLTENDWQAAARMLTDFKGAGAKTATLAEAFPGQTGIKTLAARAAGRDGGEQLRQQLAGREDDLAALGDTFKSRIGPEVSPANTANVLADAASSYLEGQKSLRGDALGNRLAGKTIPQEQAQAMYDSLLQAASMQRVPALQVAYKEVADKLLSTMTDAAGKPIPLNVVQDISLQIKSLKEAAKNPLSINNGATQISGNYLKEPIGTVERQLEALSPDYAGGMQDFRAFSRVLEDDFAGPIGRLADRNPLSPQATPVGRLNAVTEGQTPDDITATMRTLNNPMMAFPTASPRDIARAIAQLRLKERPENPAQAMRGNVGSDKEEQFNAILRAGKMDVDNINQPLRAADAMTLRPGQSINGMPEMRAMQGVLRPFRTADMMMTASTEKGIQREIAELLANPTPEALAELRRIAMFDPTARTAISAISGLLPQSLLIPQEGQ